MRRGISNHTLDKFLRPAGDFPGVTDSVTFAMPSYSMRVVTFTNTSGTDIHPHTVADSSSDSYTKFPDFVHE